MPGLDYEERQINETAYLLRRSSFVEIVLCGQFCFRDLKSVFGGCVCGEWGLLISSGSLAHDACHAGGSCCLRCVSFEWQRRQRAGININLCRLGKVGRALIAGIDGSKQLLIKRKRLRIIYFYFNQKKSETI